MESSLLRTRLPAVSCRHATLMPSARPMSGCMGYKNQKEPGRRQWHHLAHDKSARLSHRTYQCLPSRSRNAAAFSSSAAKRDDTASSHHAVGSTAAPKLSWNDFLKLRKRRRLVNLGASAGTALASVSAAAPLAMQYEFDDYIAAVTGLDPFIAFGLVITGAGGLGWLMGPFVGNAGFSLWNRPIRGEIARKEKEFYSHIKRFRADPASSSVNNPVPDYYGEKITSVADYRRWLKDQRAFNRKKNKNML